MCLRSRVVVCVCSGGAGEAGDVNGCEVDDCVLGVRQTISALQKTWSVEGHLPVGCSTTIRGRLKYLLMSRPPVVCVCLSLCALSHPQFIGAACRETDHHPLAPAPPLPSAL